MSSFCWTYNNFFKTGNRRIKRFHVIARRCRTSSRHITDTMLCYMGFRFSRPHISHVIYNDEVHLCSSIAYSNLILYFTYISISVLPT
jgi:queuine/archaeosine tRNA-ribosyltransferase